MGLVYAKERFQERGGKNAGIAATTDVRSWTVRTDDKNMTRFQVEDAMVLAGKLPGRFEPHPERFWLTARDVDCKQWTESPFMWTVVVNYSSEPIGEEEEDEEQSQNPLNMRTHIDVTPVKTEKAIDKDRDGNAIVNSAGDGYTDNPVMKRVTMKVINCWKYFQAGSVPDWHNGFTDKISSAPLTVYGETYPEGTLMFAPGKIHDPTTKHGQRVQKVEWALEHDKDGWQEKRLSAGYNYIPSGGSKRPILLPLDGDEDEQERPSEAQFLKANGDVAENPADAEEIEFLRYEEFDPNDLPMRTF